MFQQGLNGSVRFVEERSNAAHFDPLSPRGGPELSSHKYRMDESQDFLRESPASCEPFPEEVSTNVRHEHEIRT